MMVTLGAASNSTWWPVVPPRASSGLIDMVALGSVGAAVTVMTRLAVDSTNTSYEVTAGENSGVERADVERQGFQGGVGRFWCVVGNALWAALVMAGASVPVAAVRSGLSPGV